MPDHSMPSHTIPSPPDVTVVVPTKNATPTLAACLQSLRSQTHPCRTVVVDNGSTDSTRAIAEDGADAVLEIGPERSAQRNPFGSTSSHDRLTNISNVPETKS